MSHDLYISAIFCCVNQTQLKPMLKDTLTEIRVAFLIEELCDFQT